MTRDLDWDRNGTAGIFGRLKTVKTCKEPDQQVYKTVKTANPYKARERNSRLILMIRRGLVSGLDGHSGHEHITHS
jgi:hypothetical protein